MMSHSLWVRELKLRSAALTAHGRQSHSLWVRELKYYIKMNNENQE